MAVVAVKSTTITNRDATPKVLNQGRASGGMVKTYRDYVAIANGDSVGSTYRVVAIPSNAVVVSVRVTSPDIGTTTISDVGLYQTTANGGAVVDADFFGSAVSLSGGAITKSEVMFESGVITNANINKAIWDHLGLSADTNRDYDVTLTLTGAADAAGNVIVEVDVAV